MSKQSMEYGSKELNHFRAGPLRVVGKALHIMASSFVYKLTWVTYILTCSSEERGFDDAINEGMATSVCLWWYRVSDNGGEG